MTYYYILETLSSVIHHHFFCQQTTKYFEGIFKNDVELSPKKERKAELLKTMAVWGHIL